MAGVVVWICGLSGSGKSTLAVELAARLRANGHNPLVLDGDAIRSVLGLTDTDAYSIEGRRNVSVRLRRLAALLSSQGQNVIATNISVKSQILEGNREHLQRYFEIHLDASLSLVKARDPKRLYERALLGEEDNVVGVDLPYESPLRPDLRIQMMPELSVSHCNALIAKALSAKFPEFAQIMAIE